VSKTHNLDFEEFKRNISWFVKSQDKIEFLNTDFGFEPSEEFQNTFPKLSSLVREARILNLKINDQLYRLLSWTNKDNASCGWLNIIETNIEPAIELIDEHKMLLNEIGGIQESYNQPEPSLSNNQNFLFIASLCLKGIGGWDSYYDDMCKEYGKPKISYEGFVCFVQEANGDVTVYDPITKAVLLFSHDHCFDNVEFMENQPKYTFHTINGINNFVDYVEKLAEEWINEITRQTKKGSKWLTRWFNVK
jgi:hypothetical protein